LSRDERGEDERKERQEEAHGGSLVGAKQFPGKIFLFKDRLNKILV